MDSLKIANIRDFCLNQGAQNIPRDLTIEEFFSMQSTKPPGFDDVPHIAKSTPTEPVPPPAQSAPVPIPVPSPSASLIPVPPPSSVGPKKDPPVATEPSPSSSHPQEAESKSAPESTNPVPSASIHSEVPVSVPVPASTPPAVPAGPSESHGDQEKKTEDIEWVTVKTRSKKKTESDTFQASPVKFETLAEQQLSSNKNKKKAVKKKLKEIKELQKKQADGLKLNPHQLLKLQNKEALEKELVSLT